MHISSLNFYYRKAKKTKQNSFIYLLEIASYVSKNSSLHWNVNCQPEKICFLPDSRARDSLGYFTTYSNHGPMIVYAIWQLNGLEQHQALCVADTELGHCLLLFSSQIFKPLLIYETCQSFLYMCNFDLTNS